MEMESLQLPALGRPFTLGTLYNANTNEIIPAISLYDHENADVKIHKNITYNTDMTSTDSLESKMKSLGIRGSLTISALANKVEFKGSGSYFSEMKTSRRQARVVLESRGSTRHEALSNNCFSKEKVETHLEMIKVFGITHVAVEITYGHQIFLQLETTCASEEEKHKVEGAIKLKFSSWIPVEAEGDLGGTNISEYKRELNELTVKIHGTVEVKTPTSLQEAIDIFKQIPDLVKDKDSPMTVYLLPLAAIHSSIPNVCRKIKEDILSKIKAVFEDISSSEVALNGIQSSDIASKVPNIRQNAKQLANMVNSYKMRLQINLADILGDLKMDISEQMLEILRKYEKSPFSADILGVYVSKLEKEVQFMEDLVRMLSRSIKDGSSGDGANSERRGAGRKKFTIDIRSDEIYFPICCASSIIIVLELPIITEKNNLLLAMKSHQKNNDEEWAHFIAEPLTLPFEDKEMQMAIEHCGKIIVQIANKRNPFIEEVCDGADVNTCTCVFKGYKDKLSKPSLVMYNGLTPFAWIV